MKQLKVLENLIKERKEMLPYGSYTTRLLTEANLLERKLNEEMYEVIEATFLNDREQMKYEVSDLLYHLFVMLGKYGIPSQEIEEELMRRGEEL